MNKLFKMLPKLMVLLSLLSIMPNAASAQAWESGVSPWVRDWTHANAGTPAPVGDGVQRGSEIFTSTQGGTPPAMLTEVANIGNLGNYTDTDWKIAAIGCGSDQCLPDFGEGKFRVLCPRSHTLKEDPILAFGSTNGPHLHEFFGNFGANRNSTYTTLRTNPKSNCSGGPLAASAYWAPALLEEIQTGVYVEVYSEGAVFYYENESGLGPKLVRPPNGLALIGGVNPADRFNVARLAELPSNIDKEPVPTSGAKYTGTGERYNGWQGWVCSKRTNPEYSGYPEPVLNPNNTADEASPHGGMVRKLRNDDGSDPWTTDGGVSTCEGPAYQLIAEMTAPPCWYGKSKTSPNGREHIVYKVRRTDNAGGGQCPDGSWEVVTFLVKEFFPAQTASKRAKWFLSSDRMDPNPSNWNPAGSTFHFDLIWAWDRPTSNSWNRYCNGMTINGVTGTISTCPTDIIGPNLTLKTGTSPNEALGPSPLGSIIAFPNGPSKKIYGPVIRDGRYNSSIVNVQMKHMH